MGRFHKNKSFEGVSEDLKRWRIRILIYRIVVNLNGASSSTAVGGPPSPALGKVYAKRNLLQFCSREKDFMATDKDAPQFYQSLPQGRGRCRVATDEDAPFQWTTSR